MNTRRNFLGQIAAGATFVPAILRGAEPTVPQVKILDTRTISHEPQYYHGWPTLARRRNGELLVVCSGGRQSHVCPFGRVELMVSRDDGRSWTWPRVLLDSDLDDRDAGVLETGKGTLLVTTFTSLAYESILNEAIEKGDWPSDKLNAWLAARDRLSAEGRRSDLGQWMIRSEDGGQTWSERYSSIVNSPHGPVQLHDGRLLYAGKELWTGAGRVGFCESTNDGRTWQWLAELPVRDGDRTDEYHELHVVESESGKLITHIRNENPTNDNETLQSESSDGGRTWTTPHPIGVWGLPSHLVRLHDGNLLMSYGHRRPPLGNQARVSDDEGATWSEPMIISADGAGGDLGYPSTVELPDHDLLTVWYERLAAQPNAVLRQARWNFVL